MPKFMVIGVLSAPFVVPEVEADSRELAFHDVLARDPTELVGMASGPSSVGTMNASELPGEAPPTEPASEGGSRHSRKHKATED